MAEKHSGSSSAIVSKLVKVTREDLSDMGIASCPILEDMNCRATRIVRDGRLVPLDSEDKLVCNTEILVVGTADSLTIAGMTLGKVLDNPYAIDSCNERRELILTSPSYAGQTLRHADPLGTDHIIISRISRLGFTFIPNGNTILERNDILTVVGNPATIDAYATKIGHRSTAINATDIMSLGFGLCLGIIIGMVKIGLGEDASISLGTAGGPLIVALVLGHFGKIGPFVGYIPRPTRVLLQDLGLVFFLAGAGIAGGDDLLNTVSQYGAKVFIMGMIVTSIPLLLGYWVGKKLFKMNILEILGGICGGMTSTPALGTLTAKTDSQLPVVSYATAYPAALILMTLGAKFIISLLGV
jgi:putative transport protein